MGQLADVDCDSKKKAFTTREGTTRFGLRGKYDRYLRSAR